MASEGLTREEFEQLQDVSRRCDESGGDGAEVYEATELALHLEAKYGKPVGELENDYRDRRCM